jgi:hypothetical protein
LISERGENILAISEQLLNEVSCNLLKLASTYLPDEVVVALKKAYDGETEPIARKQLEAILTNIELARKIGFRYVRILACLCFLSIWEQMLSSPEILIAHSGARRKGPPRQCH